MPGRRLKRSMARVLCLGDSCADIMIPYGDLLKGKDVSVSFSCGGACANSAAALGRLGVDVSFAGKAGKDLYGLTMKKELEECGVDTEYFRIDDSLVSTQILVVLNENSERYPFLMPKNNPSYLQIFPEELDKIDLSDTEYVLTNGMMLFQQPAAGSICAFLDRAHRKGIRILLDINYRIETIHQDNACLLEIVQLSDYLLGSIEDDFLPLTGGKDIEEAIRKLTAPDKVIIARNSEGSTVYTSAEEYFCPRYEVDVCDTLGAGDAFNAGFIYGLTKGNNLETCNRYGCASAAFCVSGKGARHTPDEEELLRFILNH